MIAAAVWITAFALMAVWLAVYLYLTSEDRPPLPRRPAPPTVADAQTSAGAGRNPAQSGLPADKRMVPPAATIRVHLAVATALAHAAEAQATRPWADTTGTFTAIVLGES